MIAEGDSAARHAFRVGLRDTPLPLPASVTQELDPGDILEVCDMAEAIARAEKIVTAPRSSNAVAAHAAVPADIFDSLGRPTDDTTGPATPAPARTSSAPPPPRYLVLPVVVTDDDAYYQPAGRMRGLADITLDGYRAEPTLLVRAASRRKRFAWVLLAALLPLITLAGFAFSSLAVAEDGAPVTKRTASVATSTKTPAALRSASAKAGAPSFHVNNLPAALGEHGLRGKPRPVR